MAKKKNFILEFKEFISRGNVVDMAVGVVVGSAFTAIVNSLVKDIIMPFVGWIIGGIDFGDFRLILSPAEGETPETAILYGSFFNQVLNFLIISFVVFCMIKLIGRLRRKREEEKEEPSVPPAPSEDILLLTEIRDLLKAQAGPSSLPEESPADR
ncbi:MAG: large-conductance mechanosensitive channel protein MscL [Provencibacterium sp.]|nr:large-conductance mechanosensitive channel protein MscL [Provencibacterium sp.]